MTETFSKGGDSNKIEGLPVVNVTLEELRAELDANKAAKEKLLAEKPSDTDLADEFKSFKYKAKLAKANDVYRQSYVNVLANSPAVGALNNNNKKYKDIFNGYQGDWKMVVVDKEAIEAVKDSVTLEKAIIAGTRQPMSLDIDLTKTETDPATGKPFAFKSPTTNQVESPEKIALDLEKANKVAKVTSFEELFALLDSFGMVESKTYGTWNSNALKSLINDARGITKNGKGLDAVPRTFDLRNKVLDLINEEIGLKKSLSVNDFKPGEQEAAKAEWLKNNPQGDEADMILPRSEDLPLDDSGAVDPKVKISSPTETAVLGLPVQPNNTETVDTSYIDMALGNAPKPTESKPDNEVDMSYVDMALGGTSKSPEKKKYENSVEFVEIAQKEHATAAQEYSDSIIKSNGGSLDTKSPPFDSGQNTVDAVVPTAKSSEVVSPAPEVPPQTIRPAKEQEPPVEKFENSVAAAPVIMEGISHVLDQRKQESQSRLERMGLKVKAGLDKWKNAKPRYKIALGVTLAGASIATGGLTAVIGSGVMKSLSAASYASGFYDKILKAEQVKNPDVKKGWIAVRSLGYGIVAALATSALVASLLDNVDVGDALDTVKEKMGGIKDTLKDWFSSLNSSPVGLPHDPAAINDLYLPYEPVNPLDLHTATPSLQHPISVPQGHPVAVTSNLEPEPYLTATSGAPSVAGVTAVEPEPYITATSSSQLASVEPYSTPNPSFVQSLQHPISVPAVPEGVLLDGSGNPVLDSEGNHIVYGGGAGDGRNN